MYLQSITEGGRIPQLYYIIPYYECNNYQFYGASITFFFLNKSKH